MIDNSRFAELDSSLFKAFVFAARELNFTRAAEKAAMTQSGVSQTIGKLERQLGRLLFLRINKTVSLTDAGQVLLDYIERQQDELEALFTRLGAGHQVLRGPVRYAMPHSCLFTPHFPLLLKARDQFDQITLKINLCSNEEVVHQVLNREVDFGFLTRKNAHPGLSHELFARETYVLVGQTELVSRLRPSLENLHTMPFVDFPGMRNLFEIWKSGVAAKRRSLNYEALNFCGEINSLHGAVTMLKHGLGFAIMPRHVVEAELRRQMLEEVSVAGRRDVTSEIHIVTLSGAPQPARVQTVIQAFREMK